MSATLFTVQSALNKTRRDGYVQEKSLTCACYTSGCQELDGSCAAQPVVMLILYVVVILEQVVIVIVAIVCVIRSCIAMHWRDRR